MITEFIDGPILDSNNFITYTELCEKIGEEQFPVFLANVLVKNKMKTKKIVIDDKEYRVYYKWSRELQEFVYYFDLYEIYFVLRPFQGGHSRLFVILNDTENSMTFEEFKTLVTGQTTNNN